MRGNLPARSSGTTVEADVGTPDLRTTTIGTGLGSLDNTQTAVIDASLARAYRGYQNDNNDDITCYASGDSLQSLGWRLARLRRTFPTDQRCMRNCITFACWRTSLPLPIITHTCCNVDVSARKYVIFTIGVGTMCSFVSICAYVVVVMFCAHVMTKPAATVVAAGFHDRSDGTEDYSSIVQFLIS